MISAAMIALALIAGVLQDAASQPSVCVAPQVPTVERPVKPQRPPMPTCVNEATRRHTCTNRVIVTYDTSMTAYGAAFDAYVAGLNAYIKKLSDYAAAAQEYGQCEQKLVMPTTIIQG